MLSGNPVIGREFLDRPFPAEPADTAVLLTTERTRPGVIHAGAVDMRHACLHLRGKSQTTDFIAGEYSARQSVQLCPSYQGIFNFLLEFRWRWTRLYRYKIADALHSSIPRTTLSASSFWYCHSTSPLRVIHPFETVT
jgi:hypothetical protein